MNCLLNNDNWNQINNRIESDLSLSRERDVTAGHWLWLFIAFLKLTKKTN